MVMADIFVVVRNVQAAAYCRESSFLGERKLLSYRDLVELFWRARSFVCHKEQTNDGCCMISREFVQHNACA